MDIKKPPEQYWVDRALSLEEQWHNQAVAANEEIMSLFEWAIALLEDLLHEWYGRYFGNTAPNYADANKRLSDAEFDAFKRRARRLAANIEGLNERDFDRWILDLQGLHARKRITRLQQLLLELEAISGALHQAENKVLTAFLGEIFSASYYRTAFDIFKGFGIGTNLDWLDEDYIAHVLDKPWAPDRLSYYERLLRNEKILLTDSQKLIIKHLNLGSAPQKVVSDLVKELGRDRRSASTMVASESAFFANEARKDCMNRLEVEQYRIVATLDMKTSEICREMDGKIFPMKDYLAGATAPPFHVRCRTTTAPYYKDMDAFAERIARDNNNNVYYVPADMQYKEWYAQYIED